MTEILLWNVPCFVIAASDLVRDSLDGGAVKECEAQVEKSMTHTKTTGVYTSTH